jgi:oligopeptide transport system ATP-binding protein
MYAGRLVETAPAVPLYAAPRHPYTQGLLESLPRLDSKLGETLPAIGGLPPNLLAMPAGCPFSPRCQHAVARCSAGSPPPLTILGDDRAVACWLMDSPAVLAASRRAGIRSATAADAADEAITPAGSPAPHLGGQVAGDAIGGQS